MNITGGCLKSRKIISPKGKNVRPTLAKTRESLFNVLSNLMSFEGKTFLDVFAGSGIIGFEAVSRGFQQAVFIENDRKTFNLLKENAKTLGIDAEFYFGSSQKIIKSLEKTFDAIFLDPPYSMGLYDDVICIIKEKKLLNNGGILILEHPEGLKINTDGFEIIKQKKYSDKMLTFLK